MSEGNTARPCSMWTMPRRERATRESLPIDSSSMLDAAAHGAHDARDRLDEARLARRRSGPTTAVHFAPAQRQADERDDRTCPAGDGHVRRGELLAQHLRVAHVGRDHGGVGAARRPAGRRRARAPKSSTVDRGHTDAHEIEVVLDEDERACRSEPGLSDARSPSARCSSCESPAAGSSRMITRGRDSTWAATSTRRRVPTSTLRKARASGPGTRRTRARSSISSRVRRRRATKRTIGLDGQRRAARGPAGTCGAGPDAPARSATCRPESSPFEQHPAVPRQESAQGVDERRLTRAVRSDQSHDRTLQARRCRRRRAP